MNVEIANIENEMEKNKKIAYIKNDPHNNVVDLITSVYEYYYERHFCHLAKLVVKEGDSVVDVGGNMGIHTVTLSRTVGKNGKVYSFEPNRVTFQQLNCNVFLNGLFNVYSYNVAVGENIGEIYIDDFDYNVGTPNSGDTCVNNKKIGSKVPLISLDSLDLQNISLIKMDVQGYELFALKGATNTINKFKPILFVEIDDRCTNWHKYSSKEIVKYLKTLNYKIYSIVEKHSGDTNPDHLCIHDSINFDFSKYPFQLIER